VSTEGSTQQTTQEASSSLPPALGKLHYNVTSSNISLAGNVAHHG